MTNDDTLRNSLPASLGGANRAIPPSKDIISSVLAASADSRVAGLVPESSFPGATGPGTAGHAGYVCAPTPVASEREATIANSESSLLLGVQKGVEPAIVTRDLNLWYGDFQALREVTATIRRGSITSLIGPSGCGKTTLLRCFNRVNERYGNVRTSGVIEILGKNIYDKDVELTELRKAVGMVFQRPNPLPVSIYENVVFGMRVHTPSTQLSRTLLDEAVESALSKVGLWNDVKDRLREKATSLQLEQQQKLCIARLLPVKPELILMDEPCSALDVEGTRAVEELMWSLAGHYTIVIVTHNMAQARRASEECIFMLLGRLVEHQRTEDLFISPRDSRTAEYIEGRYG